MTHSSNSWRQRILQPFTADLSRLWVACDPDGVLLDEKLLSELRTRGFEVMGYDDPFGFRAEYEERYRAAWDANEPAPSPALIVHLLRDNADDLPWDIIYSARLAVRLSLAELFPKLAYSAVRQVEPERLAALFDAHQTELQSARGEGESKDFILEHVYQLTPRSIRTPVDFWREALRLHFANRTLPEPFAGHVVDILRGKGLFTGQLMVEWLSSKSALLRVVQDAWYRYLAKVEPASSRLYFQPALLPAGWKPALLCALPSLILRPSARAKPTRRSKFPSTTPTCAPSLTRCSSTAACTHWR
jgi:hypothetical protein